MKHHPNSPEEARRREQAKFKNRQNKIKKSSDDNKNMKLKAFYNYY